MIHLYEYGGCTKHDRPAMPVLIEGDSEANYNVAMENLFVKAFKAVHSALETMWRFWLGRGTSWNPMGIIAGL